MTPRSLILMKAFWFYGRFSEAMSFSRFALLSQKSQFMYRKFSIVWLPWVKCLLLLCKAKPAWIKRSLHYVTLPHYNTGELLKEIPPYLRRDFWYKRCKFWKWHCLRKMALESKTPSSKLTILGVILLDFFYFLYAIMHATFSFCPSFSWNYWS